MVRKEPAKFHLNRMPAEIVHMICKYLTPTQIASIRLMGSMIAAIGLEYIATTVTLTLKETSFDRLLEIAHHPVIGKFVHDLHYEHDFLKRVDRRVWESYIQTPEFIAAPDWNSITQHGSHNPSDKYGKKRLDQAFLTYQDHCAEQDRVRKLDFFPDKLADALQHLPNLKTIYMPKHGCYSRYQSEIAEYLTGAFYDQSAVQSNSVAVTRSVLLAMDLAIRGGRSKTTKAFIVVDEAALRASSRISSNANHGDRMDNDKVTASLGGGFTMGDYLEEVNTESSNKSLVKIKSFISESFNWRLLLEGDEVFAIMKKSISHLTKFEIRILDGCWITESSSPFLRSPYKPHYEPVDTEARRQSLKRGRLHEFVTSAAVLEELSVSLDPHIKLSNVYLTDVVGCSHWTFLKTVHFQRINMTIGSLEDFCSRHSATLSNISLGDLHIDGLDSYERRDSWYSVFTSVREITKLRTANVYGVFEPCGILDMHDHEDLRYTTGTLIGRYLVDEGGSSSLKQFLTEERARFAEQEGDPSINDSDDVSSISESTSESGDSSSESVA